MEENIAPDQPVKKNLKQDITEPTLVNDVKEKMVVLQQQVGSEDVKAFIKNNSLQLITAAACVGILLNNRRSLKFTKKVVKNMDKNVQGAQETIIALKEARQKFTFYPGVGVYVD